MTPAGKYSLTSEQKINLQIPAQAESYIFIWDNVEESETKKYDKHIKDDGFKIAHKELKPSLNANFDYELTVFKPLK